MLTTFCGSSMDKKITSQFLTGITVTRVLKDIRSVEMPTNPFALRSYVVLQSYMRSNAIR